MSGKLESLALSVDPAHVREAARLWRGRNHYGLLLRPAQLAVGLVYVALGVAGLLIVRPTALTSMPAIVSAVFILLGAISALQGIGKLDFQPRPLVFVAMELDETAIVITDTQGMRRTFAWQAVRSVQRTSDAVVFVLSWRRAIVIPAATLGSRQRTLWPQLYAHLVSRRGLSVTPFADASEIVNTAIT